jgi:hypothetical protein
LLRFDAVKEKFITVTKIQKRAIMDKEDKHLVLFEKQHQCRSLGLQNARHFTILAIVRRAALSHPCSYLAFSLYQS